MAASAYVMRASREQSTSKSVREKAEQNVEQLHRIAEDIRRMTRIYQERLDGRRTDDQR